MEINFLGHAAAFINTDLKILIDPFISQNPLCSQHPDEFSPDAILLTHGHRDHIGDTVSIALRTGCTVYAMAELSRWLAKQGVKVHGFNTGGSLSIGETIVSVVEAVHSSSCPDGSYGGLACGFIIRYNMKTFYHAGDTSLFAGMSLIGVKYDIDAAMLPIGGNYTMDSVDASSAVSLLSPAVCIPMHFNTFPAVMCNPDEFKELLADSRTEYRLMQPGETLVL